MVAAAADSSRIERVELVAWLLIAAGCNASSESEAVAAVTVASEKATFGVAEA